MFCWKILAQFNPNTINAINNSQINLIGIQSIDYESVDEYLKFLVNASQQIKIAIGQLKIQNEVFYDAAIQQTRVQFELEKHEALRKQHNEFITIIKNTIPNNADMIIAQLVAQLQTDRSKTTKFCANCGRDAHLECTACRVACYCSPFCQKKDWNQHQNDCALQLLFEGTNHDHEHIGTTSTVGTATKSNTSLPSTTTITNPTTNNESSNNVKIISKSKDISI